MQKLSLAALNLKQHVDVAVLQLCTNTQLPSAIQSTYKLLQPLKYSNLSKTSSVTFKSPGVWDMTPWTLAERTEALKKLDICDLHGSRANREEESDMDMKRIDIDRGTNVSYWFAHSPGLNPRAVQLRVSINFITDL
jgi:hypothetical protein